MSDLSDDVLARLRSLDLVGFVVTQAETVAEIARSGITKNGLMKAGLMKAGVMKVGVVKRGMSKMGVAHTR